MRCPRCHTANVQGNQACVSCGAPLHPETETAVPETAVPATSIPSQNVAAANVDVTKPSGRMDAGALPLLMLATLIGGVLVGVLYHFVARWIDLVVIFPLIVGFAVGALLAFVVRRKNIRRPKLATTCGFIAGLLCFGTRVFCDSVQMRELQINAIVQTMREPEYAQEAAAQGLTPQNVEARLRQRLPLTRTFVMYLQDSAEEGMTISDVGRESKSTDLTLSGPWFYGAMLLNTLFVAGIAAAAAGGAAREPFCEKCARWYGSAIGLNRVSPHRTGEMLSHVQNAQWQEVGLMTGEGADDKQFCSVEVKSCPSCQDGVLSVKSTAKGHKVLQQAIAPADVAIIEQARAQHL